MVFFYFFKSQTAGMEQQSPVAAGSQSPRLFEVLGRCRYSSQSGPHHDSLRRVHCRWRPHTSKDSKGDEDRHSMTPYTWLPSCLGQLFWSSPYYSLPSCRVELQPPSGTQVLSQVPCSAQLPVAKTTTPGLYCSLAALCTGIFLPPPWVPLQPSLTYTASTMSVNS